MFRIAGPSVAVGVAFLMLAGAQPALAQSAPLEIPFVWEWAASPHARSASESFTHWDEEGEIPVACATCHSTAGFRDHVGADGTAPGVDRPALIGGGGIACVACHNDQTRRMSSVPFPSGAAVETSGREGPCLTCHQGRESGASVEAALTGREDDTPDPTLRFINVHYRAAAATHYGTQVRGGYEFTGRDYSGPFVHTRSYGECAACHDAHTLKVRAGECATCHAGAGTMATLPQIRMSAPDFDGDGDTGEGISAEIATLQDLLLDAMRGYARDIAGTAVAYDPHSHPYFFRDTNGNGEADEAETVSSNQYRSWTPRLLRSAYNYQFAVKDPGAYAHNPDYAIQLLHDSIENLADMVPVAMGGVVRPEP